MNVHPPLPLIDEILEPWRTVLGDDFQGYRNHCIRMALFCFALKANCTPEEKKKIQIAAAFHDIGIWIENTLDYIPPSVSPAMAYLTEHKLEPWSEEITLMITEHHKLTPYQNGAFPLVEVFRQGDLVDFSLGWVRNGLKKSEVNSIRSSLPNAGFHTMLFKRGFQWLKKHPFNPAPMMKR
ncbi:MAG: HD domain-containing protein [Pseudomonadales bacterium]|nr:HD domain-containing protein [Pseudomonadales bacterium]